MLFEIDGGIKLQLSVWGRNWGCGSVISGGQLCVISVRFISSNCDLACSWLSARVSLYSLKISDQISSTIVRLEQELPDRTLRWHSVSEARNWALLDSWIRKVCNFYTSDIDVFADTFYKLLYGFCTEKSLVKVSNPTEYLLIETKNTCFG